MNGIILGALAGLVATVPMSLAMKAMHEQLPPEEQYPLPPRAITEELAARAGVRGEMDEGEREAATWANHFGYGAACGALYGALAANRRVPPLAAGVGFGLTVWAGSYLGWLPAAGILRPATEHPPRRNALMIAAHVVWGAGLGLAVHALSDEDGERG
jgi:uncharacterized membrane protein YagU involved in acid resistance